MHWMEKFTKRKRKKMFSTLNVIVVPWTLHAQCFIVDLVLILNQPFFIIRLWVSMRFYKRHVHTVNMTVTNQCRNNNKLRKSNITTSITMSAIQHDIHLYWMNTCYTNTNALFPRVNVCAARNNKSIHI